MLQTVSSEAGQNLPDLSRAVITQTAALTHGHPVGLSGGKSYTKQLSESHEHYWHAFSKRLMTFKALCVNYLLYI